MSVPTSLLLAGLALAQAASGSPGYLDVTVSGVALQDVASGAGWGKRCGFRHAGGGPGRMVACLNSTGREVLELHQHPGAMEHQFAEYRVRAAARGESTSLPSVTDTRFESGRGIRLGLPTAAVLALLGPAESQKTIGDAVTLVYRCVSPTACPELARVNMPEYRAVYSFKDDRLVAFEAGFPYP